MPLTPRLRFLLPLAVALASLLAAPAGAQGPLLNGITAFGFIDANGDFDEWTFVANAGDAVVLRAGVVDGTGGLVPRLELYGPGGVLVAVAHSNYAAEISLSASASGPYTLVVRDQTGTTADGPYRVTLARSGAPVVSVPVDAGGPLGNGTTNLGSIEMGDLDVWTVDANAGDALVIRMGRTTTGTGFRPQIRLYGPTGQLLASREANGWAEVVVTAPDTAAYLVVVGDGSSDLMGVGGYRLTLARSGVAAETSDGDEGGSLENGVKYAGTIDGGDLDVWTFLADSGQAIIARMGDIPNGGDIAPQLRLCAPTGAVLDTSQANVVAEVEARAPKTGLYLLVASNSSAGSTTSGDYRLTLAKTGAPVTVSPGDEGGSLPVGASFGEIDTGDLDLWTRPATAGDRLVITMKESASGSSLYSEVRLYRPDGVFMQRKAGNVSAQIDLIAPIDGDYLILASDQSTGSGGPYLLSFSTLLDVPAAGAPDALALMRGRPNPFRANTLLAYRVPTEGGVTLRIYDTLGRLVRTLVDDPGLPAGEYVAEWDGRDDAGRRVHPGVYLARVKSGRETLSRKVVLAD